MSKERELLRRALESFDWMDVDNLVTDDIRTYLNQSEIPTGCAAEPEAEFDCTRSHPHEDMSKQCEFRTEIAKLRNALANTRSEPEAETIETLKAENFKLASGQCTEGGPWGDEGSTPYCKYARPETEAEPVYLKKIEDGVWYETSESGFKSDCILPGSERKILYTRPSPARKPMKEEEIKTGHKDSNCYVLSCIDPLYNFSSGVRFAEKHHGIVSDKIKSFT